jgi:hypothetical protein
MESIFNSTDQKYIDSIISKKFENWDKNIQEKEICIKNNEKAEKLFSDLLNNSKLENIEIIKFNFQNLKDDYLNYLTFGLENKIESYLFKPKNFDGKNKNNTHLISKIYFDHINGGRVGLVHGGCLYFTLLLCVNIFLDNFGQDNFKYTVITTNTSYKKKVPSNNVMTIKVQFNDIPQQEVSAELLDYEESLCTRIICKIKKTRQTKF